MNIPFPIQANIDYVGQKRAERVFQLIVSTFALIGFAWGFYVQQFSQTLYVLAIGIAVSGLVILPPWPFWKRNSINWQKAQVQSTDTLDKSTTKKRK